MRIGIIQVSIAIAFSLIVLACGGGNSEPFAENGDQPTAEGELEGEVETAGETDPDWNDEELESEEIVEREPLFPPAQPYVLSVDRAKYTEEITFIAEERVPSSLHWQAVQDRCFQRFTEYGYTTQRHEYETGVNVIGVKQGLDPQAPQVILSAHYDHIDGCQGADDNASGVAALFEAARILGDADFSNTLVVACWDEEERGLIGSTAYVAQAVACGDEIVAAFVL